MFVFYLVEKKIKFHNLIDRIPTTISLRNNLGDRISRWEFRQVICTFVVYSAVLLDV